MEEEKSRLLTESTQVGAALREKQAGWRPLAQEGSDPPQPKLPGPPEKGGREEGVVEDPILVSQLLPSGREFVVHHL